MPRKGRDHILFLEDIAAAIRKIGKYTSGKDIRELGKDDMALDAVIRNFEIIGEAVKNVPASVRNRYPDVAWKEAAAFRDVLIHDYFGIDVEAVYDTITNNLPAFKKNVSVPLAWSWRLSDATPEQQQHFEIIGDGIGCQLGIDIIPGATWEKNVPFLRSFQRIERVPRTAP